MRDANHLSHGGARIEDADLLDLFLNRGKTLPWLPLLLEEVQYLRGASTQTDRVTYLESVLDSLGADYDD